MLDDQGEHRYQYCCPAYTFRRHLRRIGGAIEE
jgi:hypothetical protein